MGSCDRGPETEDGEMPSRLSVPPSPILRISNRSTKNGREAVVATPARVGCYAAGEGTIGGIVTGLSSIVPS